MDTTNKDNDRFKIYIRLLKYLKPLKFQFAASTFGFLVFAASQPMLAKFFEMVIAALEAKNPDSRVLLPAMAIGIFIIRGIGSFLGNYYNDFVGASVVRELKLSVFKQLVVLPAEYYDNNSQGQVLHQLNSATGQVKQAITDALKTTVREGLTVVFLLAYVFYLNWKLSLVFIMLAPILALTVVYTSRKFKNISRKIEKSLGVVMQLSKEMISNYPVVRAFGAQKYETRRFSDALDKTFKSQMKIRRVSSIFAPLTQLIVATALACIVFILLSPATLAEYTTAELIGYLTAIALLPKPFRQLSGVNAIIQRGLVGAEIVFGLMDTPAEKDEGEYESETIQGNIEVKNLNFKYPNTDKQTLKNISFSIKQGEMIALVGESGGGKSTLASLFNRSYQCADGSILIDGVDINEYKLDNLRKHVSVVDQNIFLFNNSIRSNIAYGDTEYTDEEITEAMKLSHSYDFIQGQEKGIDTIIGDNGLMLSGGQRQRLSIARAFLKKSPILILDEATSSLDNESERIIKQAIQELAKERTTIIIAHRLSTIEQADRLLVLHQGEIIETGSHKELLQKGGYYSNLFNAEFAQLSGR